MKTDNSHNSLREYIAYDVESKYANKPQAVEDNFYNTEREEMQEKYNKQVIDLWEGVE